MGTPRESAAAETTTAKTPSFFKNFPTPKLLRVPVSTAHRQHAPAIVPVGTAVRAGDRLTTTEFTNAPAVLSPVAGIVRGECSATLFNGHISRTVEIETTVSNEIETHAPAPEPTRHGYRSTDFTKWIDRLQQSGVGSSRDGCPDIIAQLNHALIRIPDTLVCGLLDSDPNLRINAALARAFPTELAAGLDLLAQLTGVKNVWVTVDPAVPSSWFAGLTPLILADGLRLIPLRGDYPQSDPTLMLHTLLDRRLRPGHLPAEQGVILLDAAATVAIGRCVLHGQPMLQQHIGIRDHVKRQTHFITAPIGTSLANLCEFLGIPSGDALFRGGDFLRDHLVPPTAVVSAGEVSLHITSQELPINPDPCVRCGWCIEACPTRVQPASLLDAAQRDEPELAGRFGLHACIECGICNYVCPSQLPLLAAIRKLKDAGMRDAGGGI